MNWRPEGWENPYAYKNLDAKPIDTGLDFANVPEIVAYEAGADAMLEVLRKTGVATYDDKDRPGYLVFIPDD
jgi:hypothetical protein